MDSVDFVQLRRRVRLAYEWSRLRRALVGFAPALLVAAAAACLGGKPFDSAPFAIGLFLAGVLALWYGREAKQAVLPGVAAGLIPVVLTVAAMHIGHLCMGVRCSSVCIAACSTGGGGAGLVVGLVGARRHHPWLFWIAASGMALLTGAIGCGCVGYPGLAGLAAGYGGGILAVRLLRFAR